MADEIAVFLTEGAARDLKAIHEADEVQDQLQEVVSKLSTLPERGSIPKELAAIGMKEYRQVLLKPYRVIYRIFGQQVVVYLIVDGRRDMQSTLSRRLLAV